MSDDDASATRRLRELGKQLPYDKPDVDRREAVRSSLLVAARQDATGDHATRKRWLLVGGGFAAGALAAAALAIVVISPRGTEAPPTREAHARIEAPPTASLEHTVTATRAGTDEVIRVRAGTVKVAVPTVRRGDRVRMQTADAEVEATGAYEVMVVEDRLERVTVSQGTAQITTRIGGQQQQVFLAAGQTWRPKVVTAAVETSDLEISAAPASNAGPPKASADPTTTDASKVPAMDDTSKANTNVPATGGVSKANTNVSSTGNASKANTNVPATGDASKTNVPATGDASKAKTNVPATGDASKANVSATRDASPSNATAPDTAHIGSAQPAVNAKSTTERHFQRGWKLLRDGKAREAAVELGIAADADTTGSDPLAVDARYFQAVALVRAGQSAAAERVLVAFIDRAGPSALRRGRAAVLLGKLLRDRGDVKSARAWFTSALGDSDPAIAGAARAHLDSLP